MKPLDVIKLSILAVADTTCTAVGFSFVKLGSIFQTAATQVAHRMDSETKKQAATPTKTGLN